MINVLSIRNFKGWEDTGRIEFSPITLFFGSNSSGKSSIGQFIMMLKQSSQFSDPRSVLFLGDENSPVELGSSIDLLYNHDTSRMLDYSYRWNLQNDQLVSDDNVEEGVFDEVEFQGKIASIKKTAATLEVNKMEYVLYNKSKKVISIGLERAQKASSARSYKFISDGKTFRRKQGRQWELPHPEKFYGFPDEVMTYYQDLFLAARLNSLHEQLFASICYLGPIRERASRRYSWKGTTPLSVGYTGKDTIHAILAARDTRRMYNFTHKGYLKSLDAVIAEALKDMGLVDEFDIKRVAEDRQDYDVKVKTKGSNTLTDIPDVGFGISQVLPVLVELFYAQPQSIIIMEQPELHLHPSAQAALADVMIKAIRAREDAKPRNIQLIIETHSEHFLRRFQRRIAEGSLNRDDFAAYFANNDHSPTTLEPLNVDLFGEITNWPKNFFGDMNGDIFAQTKAALQQKMKRTP